MPDAVAQWQFMAKDPEAVAKFYTSLFGWKVEHDNALNYRRLRTGAGGIDGGIWPSPPEGQSFVQLFIEVDDVGARARRAAELGGSILVPPQKLPDGDEVAIVLGPEGVSFGLMRRRR